MRNHHTDKKGKKIFFSAHIYVTAKAWIRTKHKMQFPLFLSFPVHRRIYWCRRKLLGGKSRKSMHSYGRQKVSRRVRTYEGHTNMLSNGLFHVREQQAWRHLVHPRVLLHTCQPLCTWHGRGRQGCRRGDRDSDGDELGQRGPQHPPLRHGGLELVGVSKTPASPRGCSR